MILFWKNLILFKAGWLACVYGAAHGLAWLGTAVVLAIALEHLRTAPGRQKEAMLLAVAAGIGLIWESILVSGGLLQYGDGFLVEGFAPYWIVAMWILFATTINVGMRWLKNNWILTSIVGAICGPAAFFFGERAGAVIFTENVLSLLAIGLGWAILLPLLAGMARRLDGYSVVPAA
ncbi:MAG: DUF2878 domain-containing protein [Puniceicoccaceae bacterium]